MTPEPTGSIVRTTDGVDIVLTRLIRGSVADVWASLTESERTTRWFGRWEGDARPGAMIRVQMSFEEGEPWTDVRIDACEPPHRLGVTTVSPEGDWQMEVSLADRGEHTELTFVHHRDTTAGAGDIGPGWEYYLDNLLASRSGDPLPSFGEYYPGMQEYYEKQAAAATA